MTRPSPERVEFAQYCAMETFPGNTRDEFIDWLTAHEARAREEEEMLSPGEALDARKHNGIFRSLMITAILRAEMLLTVH